MVEAIGGALISAGANKLLSGSSSKRVTAATPKQEEVLKPFLGGGLVGGFQDGFFDVSPTEERAGEVRALANRLGTQAATIRGGIIPRFESIFSRGVGDIEGLIGQVRPGFGRLTDSTRGVFNTARERLEGARRRAVGDVRQNLARRRVLGSSFGQDALIRAESAFDQAERVLAAAEEQALAGSLLQELDVTNRLITQKLNTELASAQTTQQNLNQAFALEADVSRVKIDELNNIAGLITQMVSGATASFGAIAQQNQQLAVQQANLESQGLGSLIQPIAQQGGEILGGIADDFILNDVFGGIPPGGFGSPFSFGF